MHNRKQQPHQIATMAAAPAIHVAFFASLSFFYFFFAVVGATTGSTGNNVTAVVGDIDWWCDTTPHPGPCKHYLMNHRSSGRCQKSEFRKMLMEATLGRALRAQIHISRASPKNRREKAAWADCLRLHDYTIHELNRAQTNCTHFDAQTWLSAALTNLQTCRLGSNELQVSSFILPLLSHNVSQLISNCLAIYGSTSAAAAQGVGREEEAAAAGEGFPSWVSAGDRRLLKAPSAASLKPNLVVAKDGSGNFKSVQAAINAAGNRAGGRFVIYVKRGVYAENIGVGKNANGIMLVGEGLKRTVITGSKSTSDGLATYNTATAGIDGLNFIARGITFINSAGPLKGQAVVLRSSSDLSVFYLCAFMGYQDTVFVHSQRQFFRQCYIYGTVDIIFGNAAAVFQNCYIYARRPANGQANIITAQGRDDPNQNSGISIHRSQIRAAKDLKKALGSVKTYLGRPWQEYSRTVIFKTYIGSFVDPVGWLAWDNTTFAQRTLYYAEYRNFGPSSSTAKRVSWPGYHALTNPNDATQFTVAGFILGRSWLPATGVPFISGI